MKIWITCKKKKNWCRELCKSWDYLVGGEWTSSDVLVCLRVVETEFVMLTSTFFLVLFVLVIALKKCFFTSIQHFVVVVVVLKLICLFLVRLLSLCTVWFQCTMTLVPVVSFCVLNQRYGAGFLYLLREAVITITVPYS